MESPEEKRRLSAIMFTDIVGYSALTQRNESLALELLKFHCTVVRPIVSTHRGTEIKTIGDAFLIEFSSAKDAVDCAVVIQRSFHEYNQSASADRSILLRIGIHIGDVVHRENDVFGDGVNIAARIEPLASPGGICLSEDIVRLTKNHIPFPVAPMPEHSLKNITLPVQLFQIQLPWLPRQEPKKQAAFESRSLNALTVAVLPFTNIGNAGGDYFSEGMTEEIISSLSKISGLDVIARTSAFKFQESQQDVTAIAKQLGAGNILGGTVRRAGDKARISIRLMDAGTQKLIWSDDYTKELSDMFSVQCDIAMNVASSLQVKLLSAEKERVQKKITENPESFQQYLLGRFQLNRRTGESIRNAVEHFTRSIVNDPNNAASFAGLSEAYTLMGGAGYGSVNRSEAIALATKNSDIAIALDDTLAEAHLAKAYVKFRIDWKWEEAEREFLHAIELKPGLAKAHELYALFLAIHRRFDEAVKRIERARDLDPLSASINTGYGRFLCFGNRWNDGFRQLQYTISIEPNHAEAHFGLCDYYLHLQNYEEALACAENALALSGRRPIILSTLGFVKAKMGDRMTAEQILTELQEMNGATHSTKFAQSNICLALGRIDEAVKLLEEAVIERDGMVIFINMDPTHFGGEDAIKKIEPILTMMGFS